MRQDFDMRLDEAALRCPYIAAAMQSIRSGANPLDAMKDCALALSMDRERLTGLLRRTQPMALISPEEFARRMRDVSECPEIGHLEADDLMCDVLRSLGYGDGAAIFEARTKWYA